MKNIDGDYNSSVIQIDVQVTSFMMAVSTFFTGFLISNYADYDASVRVPIIFLVVSTFAFLYTTNIFANASGEIMSGNKKGALKHAATGTIISEFLGIYLLAISIPLAINALTADQLLTFSVLIISLMGLFVYSVSDFSIIKRYTKGKMKYFYSITLVALATLAFMTQLSDSFLYSFFSITIFLYLLVTVLLLTSRNEHYKELLR